MEIKVKILNWSAGVPVIMLKNKTAEEIGAHVHDRVILKTLNKKSKKLTTVLDIIEKGLINSNQLAVSSEVVERLNLKNNQKVDLSICMPTKTLEFIKKKVIGKILSPEEIDNIIAGVVDNTLSEAEIALFISGMHEHGMNLKEIIALINSILKTGNKLFLKDKKIADKHSIGGVAGNRTTPLVISICAAAGLICPKTSSRAITSAAGTADVIETIANVEFTTKEIKKIIQKTGACIVWGGGLNMVPADSKIIRIEKALKIDPQAQLLASIMAKKLAMGSKFILIDIPYGEGAKVSKQKAVLLKKKFEALGKHYKKKLKVVLTDGSQPIGNGIGPLLELIDVIGILDPKKTGPIDLEEKSLFLAAELLELAGKSKKGNGLKLANEILSSGKAFKKFKQIISAQGGKMKNLSPGKFKHNILASRTGKISHIDNKKINSLARVAGCPSDKSAGLYLYFQKGERVKKNQTILTIYSESSPRLKEAIRHYNNTKPITIK